MSTTATDLSFEQAQERLDAIAERLASGEATLTESVELYEEGTALVQAMQDFLDALEQRIEEVKKGESSKRFRITASQPQGTLLAEDQ